MTYSLIKSNNELRAVILFRDVEHCGISSIQYPEFRSDELSPILRNSSQFRNSVRLPQLQRFRIKPIPGILEFSLNGIRQNRTKLEMIPGIPSWNWVKAELDRIERNSWNLGMKRNQIWFQELVGTDSGSGTSSGMFNIAE